MGNCSWKNLKILATVFMCVATITPGTEMRDVCQDGPGAFQCPSSDFEKLEPFQRQMYCFWEIFFNPQCKALRVSECCPVLTLASIGIAWAPLTGHACSTTATTAGMNLLNLLIFTGNLKNRKITPFVKLHTFHGRTSTRFQGCCSLL